MSDLNPRMVISPADFADTGQWRLIIYISGRGMKDFLKHTADPARPLAEMLSTVWTDSDPASLLRNIENAVYDHPGLLDDYATEIILETPRICFAPNEILDSAEASEDEIFNALFPGEDQEVLTDRLPDCTALFTLTRGLEGFVSRTIPGSRIRSHLAVMAERFRRQKATGPRVYVDIRDGEADILAFNDETLLSASVQRWRTPEDIAYRIFNLLTAYDRQPADTQVNLSGDRTTCETLTKILQNFCQDVIPTTLPVSLGDDAALPLAALLQAFR